MLVGAGACSAALAYSSLRRLLHLAHPITSKGCLSPNWGPQSPSPSASSGSLGPLLPVSFLGGGPGSNPWCQLYLCLGGSTYLKKNAPAFQTLQEYWKTQNLDSFGLLFHFSGTMWVLPGPCTAFNGVIPIGFWH